MCHDGYVHLTLLTDCGVLVVPSNGLVSYSSNTTYQSVATFSCDEGYSLSASKTRTCQANKTWSYQNPSCLENGTSAGIIALATLGGVAGLGAVAGGAYKLLDQRSCSKVSPEKECQGYIFVSL